MVRLIALFVLLVALAHHAGYTQSLHLNLAGIIIAPLAALAKKVSHPTRKKKVSRF